MKNKFVFINLALSVAVLFSILFQSVHGYEHWTKQVSEKKCQHEHHSDTELTHPHEAFEKCFVCAFAFSSGITPDSFSYEFQKTALDLATPFNISRAFPSFFKGALFSLRAPPTV
jgi:hypothetical protein